MSETIVPPSELLRRALGWISEVRREKPDAKVATLVDEASLRFDLSPAQAEWLLHTLSQKPTR
jgi:hypothetical protein